MPPDAAASAATIPANQQEAVPQAPSVRKDRWGGVHRWVKRSAAVLIFGTCATGGVMLGLLGQPVIKTGKAAIVDVPHQVIPLPDPEALQTVRTVIGAARERIEAQLAAPVSREIIEALVQQARKGVRVDVVVPSDAPTMGSMLRDGGCRVSTTAGVNECVLVVDQRFVLVSTVPLAGQASQVRGFMYVERSTAAGSFSRLIGLRRTP